MDDLHYKERKRKPIPVGEQRARRLPHVVRHGADFGAPVRVARDLRLRETMADLAASDIGQEQVMDGEARRLAMARLHHRRRDAQALIIQDVTQAET